LRFGFRESGTRQESDETDAQAEESQEPAESARWSKPTCSEDEVGAHDGKH